MKDTIDKMFINEKIIRIYSFYPFLPWNTRQMHFKMKIFDKHHPPHDPLKYNASFFEFTTKSIKKIISCLIVYIFSKYPTP